MPTNHWNLDTVHSDISFSVRHMVVSKVRGRFGKFSGNIELDESDLARSVVEATIDASSIDTGTAQRDDHLRSADFFDVEHFPQIRFRSTAIETLGKERYRLTGELTIRDVKRDIALDVEYGGRGKDPWGNERVGFTAKGAFDRKDFGLKWNQALETGGVLVSDRVEIELELQAVRAANAAAA
ncbi:MAG TPA: YceI family protein [Polyangia bacterium]|jgi:polyisoprenoid-binding protein YceI|nr:YceI family protein [Polyangia bacterium]